MSDLFDLLDKNIDDIADLPSFKVPDTGIYKLLLGIETKSVNDKPCVIAKLTVKELVELADSSVDEKDRAKDGDKFDVMYMLKDKDGNNQEVSWGLLKQLAEPFEAHFGTKNLKEIMKNLSTDPVAITAKIKKVARKSDKEVFDARISDITID